MTDSLLLPSEPGRSVLRCPECREVPAFTPTPTQPMAGGTFGVLRCSCAAHPVLDSIPIVRRGRVDVQDHVTGRTEVAGPDHDALVALLEADRGLDALVAMLTFPPAVPFGLGGRRKLRLPFTRGPWPSLALAARRGEVTAMLADHESLTAQDWMELCYARSSEQIAADIFPYFFARYGQPRYVASIEFARHLPVGRGAVLDLACGFGHLMYHLGARDEPLRTVGVDRNFFQLWVGRRYIAPDQEFVCADRVEALPFADDAFAASLCSDAFHLFDDQQGAADEMRRVAADDTILIDRIGNALLEPHDGDHERTPKGYAALVDGAPLRLTSEDELIDAYRAGRGLRLREERDPDELAEQKWLALVSSRDETLFDDADTLPCTPHGAGTLRINPIFHVERDDEGVHLVFRYPSTWYAFENAQMRSYTSAGEHLDPEAFDALVEGRPIAQTPLLLRRWVVLGMPPRYARRPGTPPAIGSVGEGLRRGALRRLRRTGASSRG
ncbi:methyltransferase family protein [Actinomycetospora succinea]|uniref:Methyltransferase family protein n=1 Tax=Actinomycetospora succinea TaxID=663603 RepID=A0A4R6V4E9_9PSEU|nr:class I SAM-dependent methyltransferase [Actinomycetospora succinea]TDQ51014.1 methyltransferase family protein [Actinomycetospora succinea]